MEVIKNLAGANLEKAKYYPEDENVLLEFEEQFSTMMYLHSEYGC